MESAGRELAHVARQRSIAHRIEGLGTGARTTAHAGRFEASPAADGAARKPGAGIAPARDHLLRLGHAGDDERLRLQRHGTRTELTAIVIAPAPHRAIREYRAGMVVTRGHVHRAYGRR